MNAEEQARFDFLRQGPCVSVQYIRDYYGLPWPLPDDVYPDFEAWKSRSRKRVNCDEGTVSRYELEAFMQQKDVLPKKWIGAQLGMEVASLEELLSRLKEIGMQPQRYVIYSELISGSLSAEMASSPVGLKPQPSNPILISGSLSQDLVPNLPGLKFRAFSDHNSFCLRLHAELDKVLGIKVQRLFCATSDRLQDYPRQFANSFDCITLAPVSGKHQMWLDFHKPLNLGPDRCSKLFYVENRDALRPFCAGTQEPDDLDKYIQFLAGVQHG